ncbi:MAG: hypothetical protein KAR21_23130 [Spirochaetales bacterium]|nr:hypothetical protein [Spirochaetales bacterium]
MANSLKTCLPAWRTGIEEWTRYDNEATVRAFYKTRERQELHIILPGYN